MIEIRSVFDRDKRDHIEEFCLNEVPWYHYSDISGCDRSLKDSRYLKSSGFCHVVYNNDKPNSMLFDNFLNLQRITEELADAFGVRVEKLLRIKLNLTTPILGNTTENFCMPHRDFPFDHHVFLYYINDSDGDTIFFDKEIDLNEPQLKINRRITPEKGKCVLFDGAIYHTQSNPIKNATRLNINIDVKLF